jgi:hypothetical protein
MEYRALQASPQSVGGVEGILHQFGAHVISDRPSGDPP